MEKPGKPNRLHTKYPAPIQWDSFESEQLEEYSQDETLPFLFAAVSHRAPTKIVKKILDEKEFGPNCRDSQGIPLLTCAVLHRNTEAVVTLINRKARTMYEMDRPYYTGNNDEHRALTPWQAACIIGEEKFARLLYEKMPETERASVLQKPMFHLKMTPIDYALKHKKPELAAYLCTLNPSVITHDYFTDRGTWAAQWPDDTYLKMLHTQSRPSIDRDKDKLLTAAVGARNLLGAQFLISIGAKASALMCAEAALQENKPLFDLLISTGISLKAKDYEWWNPPLRYCIDERRLQNITPVQMILEAGAEVAEQREGDADQPIHCIAERNLDLSLKQKLVDLFRMCGVPLDVPGHSGKTLLAYVCDMNKEAPFMFYLLDLGADPDAADDEGQTPFLLFCKSNRSIKKLAQFIETSGPNVNSEDSYGNTPLIYAASQGKRAQALIAALTNSGADIQKSCNKMFTKSCITLNEQLARSLLDNHTIDVNQTDSEGKTALMHVISAKTFSPREYERDAAAGERARKNLIDLLLQKGAHVNARDKTGATVLHLAVEHHVNDRTLEYLMIKGAQPDAVDAHNQSPLECALESIYHTHLNTVKLLLKYMPKKPIILSTGQTPIEYLTHTVSDRSRGITLELIELFTS